MRIPRLTLFVPSLLATALVFAAPGSALAQTAPSCWMTSNAPSNTLQYGGSARLSWSASNAVSMYITNVGAVALSGSATVSPSQSTQYTGMASDSSGNTGTCPLILYVIPPAPTGLSSQCSANGSSVTLSWNAVPGAYSYGVRVNDTTNDASNCQYGWYCSDPPDKIADYYSGTSYTTAVTLGHPYSWWVYGINSYSGGGGQTGATFTCNAPPTATLSANPTSISAGGTSTLTWSSTNATSCTGSNFSTSGATSGSISVSPQSTTSYSVTCTGSGGSASASKTVTVTPAPAPACSITFDQNPIAYGYSTIMRWTSSNASLFYINNVGYVSASSFAGVAPQATTDYSGTVWGAGGRVATCPATLAVTAPPLPTAVIYADSSSIQVGQSTVIHAAFQAGSGDRLTADNIDSPLGTSLGASASPDRGKDITFTPSAPGTYTFYARIQTSYYTSWATYAQISVTVTAAPTCSITFDSNPLALGQSTVIHWTSANASNFSINNYGSVAPNSSGSNVITPAQTTDFSGTVSSGGVSATCPATLTVSCSPAYSCSGNSILYTDSSCHTSTTATCQSPSFCSAGSATCLQPSLTVSRHLNVRPQLVQQGSSAKVYWQVSNASHCSVTGSNGDAWNSAASGEAGVATSPINQQTGYTLLCTGIDGSSIRETKTVDVVPSFREI